MFIRAISEVSLYIFVGHALTLWMLLTDNEDHVDTAEVCAGCREKIVPVRSRCILVSNSKSMIIFGVELI